MVKNPNVFLLPYNLEEAQRCISLNFSLFRLQGSIVGKRRENTKFHSIAIVLLKGNVSVDLIALSYQ